MWPKNGSGGCPRRREEDDAQVGQIGPQGRADRARCWAHKGGIFKSKEMCHKVVWAKNKERRNGLRIFFSNLIKGF
jgi:hypothetical protein